MVNLTRDAVDFVLKICFDKPEQCKIDCVTIDAVQGETFDYVVLALPPTAAEWSSWLCDATRLLTLISRNRWQMTMPWVREANPCVHDASKSSRSTTPVSAPVQAILDLQRKHDKCWSVSRLMTWLTPYQPDEVWSQWLKEVAAFTERQAAPATTTQPMETWSAATATATQPVITEKGYRGYTFRFFNTCAGSQKQ